MTVLKKIFNFLVIPALLTATASCSDETLPSNSNAVNNDTVVDTLHWSGFFTQVNDPDAVQYKTFFTGEFEFIGNTRERVKNMEGLVDPNGPYVLKILPHADAMPDLDLMIYPDSPNYRGFWYNMFYQLTPENSSRVDFILERVDGQNVMEATLPGSTDMLVTKTVELNQQKALIGLTNTSALTPLFTNSATQVRLTLSNTSYIKDPVDPTIQWRLAP